MVPTPRKVDIGFCRGDPRNFSTLTHGLPNGGYYRIPIVSLLHRTSELYFRFFFFVIQDPSKCCSDSAVSFGQLSRREFYLLEYMLYKLEPVGAIHVDWVNVYICCYIVYWYSGKFSFFVYSSVKSIALYGIFLQGKTILVYLLIVKARSIAGAINVEQYLHVGQMLFLF